MRSTDRTLRFTPIEATTLVDEKCEPILKSHPAIMKQARKVICTYESHFLTPKVNLLQSLNFCELGLNSVLEINSCPQVPKFLEQLALIIIIFVDRYEYSPPFSHCIFTKFLNPIQESKSIKNIITFLIYAGPRKPIILSQLK